MATRHAAYADSASTRVTLVRPRAPDIGQIVHGKYRIERRIGQGAMGSVYAAHHELLQRSVALKFMSWDQASTSDALARFRKEARAVAQIQSEHVARILDAGNLDDGTPFMALELLEGDDLARVLEQRAPLPIADVVDWVLQALEGLAEAHALGIVHRDLKPANLFLARKRDGTNIVKVLDFGISKNYRLSGATPTLTATSSILGSPVYMAPEQLRNAKSVDARADIWSLGVVLYELLTGQLPFRAETVAELFVAVLQHAPAPLRSWRADLPPQLEEIVMRCLSQEAEQRFPDVADLADALAPFGHSDAPLSVKRVRHIVQTAAEWTAPATRSERAPRRRGRVVAVVAALAIGAAATASLLAHGPALSTAPAAEPRGR